jgi:DNA-binding protein Fis
VRRLCGGWQSAFLLAPWLKCLPSAFLLKRFFKIWWLKFRQKMIDDQAKEIEKAFQELDRIFLKGQEGKIYRIMLDALEKSLIKDTLLVTFGNQIKAARLLGLNRNTLRAKIRKLGISLDEVKS